MFTSMFFDNVCLILVLLHVFNQQKASDYLTQYSRVNSKSTLQPLIKPSKMFYKIGYLDFEFVFPLFLFHYFSHNVCRRTLKPPHGHVNKVKNVKNGDH